MSPKTIVGTDSNREDLDKEIDLALGSGAKGLSVKSDKKADEWTWTDEKLTSILINAKKDSFNLAIYIKSMETFWCKYFGAIEPKGIGKISLYLLTQIPAPGKGPDSPFLEFPLNPDANAKTATVMVTVPEIHPFLTTTPLPDKNPCCPAQIGSSTTITADKVSHSLASDAVQDANMSQVQSGSQAPVEGTRGDTTMYEEIKKLFASLGGKWTAPPSEEAASKTKWEDGEEDVKEIIQQLSQITLYIILVLLRRVVKTDDQFLKAFTKPKFHSNYLNLMDNAINAKLPRA